MDKIKKSLSGKIWRQNYLVESDILHISRNLEISEFLAKLLLPRISEDIEPHLFLSPKLKYLLPDPFHLLDMRKAVERTISAIKNKEKICIFADYDVDGATSSALLKNLFRDLGIDSDIYVPDRIAEGYGPNIAAMQKIRDQDVRLLITVDCGAMAHEALKYAKEVGLEVIVLDHHISSDSLPECVAVVNPNRLDETSEYKYLAAVGVSFLFGIALISEMKNAGNFVNRSAPDMMQYLDLVALGTVCDVMPLIKLNRCFVSQGLKIMMQRRNIGIKELADTARLDEKLNCYHLGFALGPRINAGGRVGRSSLGAQLLSTLNESEAKFLVIELDKHNDERKIIELSIIEEAIKIAESQINDNSLFVVGSGWHPGVIGIVASRLKEKFNKPVSVVALNGGIGKASCRSIVGVNFASKIANAKINNLIMLGGGHAMAAGFTVCEEKLQELQIFLNQAFAVDIAKLPEDRVELFDMELQLQSINLDLIDEISKLEPFGHGNHEPLFKLSNLFVIKSDIVGTNHIRCLISSSNQSKSIVAIAFNAVAMHLGEILLSSKKYNFSIIGLLKLNSWQGKYSVQLQIKDLILEEF